MKRATFLAFVAIAICAVCRVSALQINVEREGAKKIAVVMATSAGTSAQKAFNASLKRNLEISGLFRVQSEGSITVSGTPGATVTARGDGKTVSTSAAFSDDRSARMAARSLADAMVKAYSDGEQTGFAQCKLAFIDRKGKDNGELYTCYPDGYDIMQATRDHHAAVGPRWAPNGTDIYYTGFFENTPLVYRLNTKSGERTRLARFKGLATGAAISPNGAKCAIILSYEGNPELYVLDLASKTVQRMTKTPGAAEGQPCWSPDGTKIAYVSNETRSPQVYILDVASRRKVRFTTSGSQNTDPDWSADGKLTWTTYRGGQRYIAVAKAGASDADARLVTPPGTWEHPSWARDSRHLVASRDKALFIVDTDPKSEEKPVRIFANAGNWMNPSFGN